MKAVNKIKKPKLTKGDWVWIAFAILLFLGGGLAGLFFIFCLWLFVFSVRVPFEIVPGSLPHIRMIDNKGMKL